MVTSKPSSTNCPNFSLSQKTCERRSKENRDRVVDIANRFVAVCQPYSGGYSSGVPPLPIPNREVKPVHADGTAQVGE